MGVYLRQFNMPTKSIAVPGAVYDRVQEVAAAEGTTIEQLATKALERDLARRWLDRVGREGDLRRGNMTDAEVEALVERAVQESRARS
jgi:ribosomal protein L13E